MRHLLVFAAIMVTRPPLATFLLVTQPLPFFSSACASGLMFNSRHDITDNNYDITLEQAIDYLENARSDRPDQDLLLFKLNTLYFWKKIMSKLSKQFYWHVQSYRKSLICVAYVVN
jgi:hypothetical protein